MKPSCLLLTTLAAVSFAGLVASPAAAQTSRWGVHVGYDTGVNEQTFCSPFNVNESVLPNKVESRFRRLRSNGSLTEVVRTDAATETSMHCYESSSRTGTAVIAKGASSSDASGERSSVSCPSTHKYGKWPECRIVASVGLSTDFVYRATRCGNGVTSISTALNGQGTGEVGGFGQVLDHHGIPAQWHYNDTALQAHVYGVDYGYPYFSDGRLNFPFWRLPRF
jgi:hypothetical protein